MYGPFTVSIPCIYHEKQRMNEGKQATKERRGGRVHELPHLQK